MALSYNMQHSYSISICDRILENRPNCHISQNQLFYTKRVEVMNTIIWQSFTAMRKRVAVIDAHFYTIH